MLVYHPAFDLYNCIFRMMQLLLHASMKTIEVEKFRIWDFYLAFPNEARKISFPMDLSELKKVFKDVPANAYEDLIDPKRVLERMRPFQTTALTCLAAYGFVEQDSLEKNIVAKTDKTIPEELKVKLSSLSVEKENVLKLVYGFQELPLYGKIGLKARTGLLDFRYDPK